MAQMIDKDAPQASPAPNVYTVMIIIACLALATTLGFVMMNLTNPPEKGGYGLTFGQMFDPPEKIEPKPLPKMPDFSRKPAPAPGPGAP